MIIDQLWALRDEEYAAFQSKLTPGIGPELFIGVRVPEVRKLAKQLLRENPAKAEQFLLTLPHRYYDENMLHAVLVSEEKDFERCMERVEAFLPYVDNWAVCDIMSPKCFRRNREALLAKIRQWCRSEKVYTVRFGMEMLMSHFLDDAFEPEYLEIPAAVNSGEYYVNMMTAWFFATALAKQWDASIVYLQQARLAPWVHNKTIQKAIESYRITPEQKAYLRTLKRKA